MDGGAWQATVHGVAKSQDNLEEMGRFTENLSRLYQEEIEITNNPITSTEIEAMIKNLSKSKSPNQMASQENSIKYLEKS